MQVMNTMQPKANDRKMKISHFKAKAGAKVRAAEQAYMKST